MSTLQNVQPDAYQKLCEAGLERWSRAHCPLVRYNYMTSNSVESVNAKSVIHRKEPVLKLAETYRAMVQEWYYKRRQLAENMTYEITDWAAHKVAKKSMKSATWVVKGVNNYQYEVSDGQYIRAVNLHTGICECRKWQLSGIPCGHVIAVTRFIGLTDCVQYVADWFKKPKYQGTYSESIHFLGNMSQWDFPQNIQKAIPPRIDNPQPGRPKNTNRIQSQREEPRLIHCSRCTQAGHRVAGKLHIFVSHNLIDLSTVLIPNDDSLEESFAGVILEETKIKLEESLSYLHQMQKRKNKKFDYYELLGELALYKLEIYVDHIGVNFVISKYIFPNASLAEMMNHVITDYSSENEDTKRQTDHTISPISTILSSTLDYCLSHTHFFSPLTNYMADWANEARQTIVSKLQREIRAEETLANQLLCNLNRYSEEMRIRDVQITMLQTMPATSLNTYGLHALLMTLESDIRTTNNILRTRQQLLRSITAKQNYINNYMAI
ncbi:transposase, MuDR, MULE transposase domain protein [Tanacetum coccineum]